MRMVCDVLGCQPLRPLTLCRLQRIDLQPDDQLVEIGPHLEAVARFPVVSGPSALQSQHDGL